MNQRIYQHLAFLYGEDKAVSLTERLENKLAKFAGSYPHLKARRADERVSEKDTILITYGDIVQEKGQAPLQTLANFLAETVRGTISSVHILPFYPYSSDDGFSVIDYLQVDPNLGSWDDVAQIGRDFRLMFDAVVNHISVESEWFTKFVEGDPHYSNYFTVIQPGADLSQVFRPRALPLLTEVETTEGSKSIWTTFSSDQVDLNYAEPEVLLEVIDTLLFYVGHGAEFIRLDAIAFIWKEEGTSCIHLPQTHEIIRLLRTVLDVAAPTVAIITETNVPHKDNITYFGNGTDEAQMVYNFSLPPLTLHAFQTANAETLTAWARTLELPSKETTFFNFLASHDGIGLTPARGLLADEDIKIMVDRVEELGGYVSYKTNPDGTKSAYELNINFLDALGGLQDDPEDNEIAARRFIAAQAIMLVLRGVPGIYFHSLFGSRNWIEGVQKTGRFRTINRQKLQAGKLRAELSNPDELRTKVFTYFKKLIAARSKEPAFHPNGEQIVLAIDPAVFALKRSALNGRSTVYCLQNVSPEPKQVSLNVGNAVLQNILSGTVYKSNQITMEPFAVLWLKPLESG